MEAKELRIGNVTNKGIVVEIHKDYFYTHDLESSYRSSWFDVDPVLLDEKWLIKFGFVFEQEHFLCKGLTLNINDWVQFYSDNQDNYDNCVLYIGLRDIDEDFLNQKIVQYVHEFQNLYFAITGNEL